MVIYFHEIKNQIEDFAEKYFIMLDKKKKDEFKTKFGKRLGQIKNNKKLSYRIIAKNCDLDPSFISKIEKGTENITLETILNLLYGLDVQPNELFDFYVELNKDDIRK